MADETHLAPPPETGLTGAPRKPWAKPTIRVIGETMDSIQSGPYGGDPRETASYTATS